MFGDTELKAVVPFVVRIPFASGLPWVGRTWIPEKVNWAFDPAVSPLTSASDPSRSRSLARILSSESAG